MSKESVMKRSAGLYRGLLLGLFVLLIGLPQAKAQNLMKLPKLNVAELQKEVDRGVPESFYVMGTIYFKGTNGVPDYPKAVEYLTRAAEQGIAIAQVNLGDIYFDGTKVPQNDELALRWYQAAAIQGVTEAQYKMGIIYENGRGTDKNETKAAKWFTEAAKQGYAPAQNKLGVLYANGNGVRSDPVAAYKWLSLAAAQGLPEAISNRDDLRDNITREQVLLAQRRASGFKPMPHFNHDELTRQRKKILDCAKSIKG
jgi:TPR repeat protein